MIRLTLRSVFGALLAPVVVLGGALTAPETHAFTYVMMKDGDLLAQSDLVVAGEILGSTPVVDTEGTIVATRYQLSVTDRIKGTSPDNIEVQIPGAPTPGEGRIYLHGSPHYAEQERVVLFLEAGEQGVYRPEQYALGAFKVKTWEGTDYAVRELHGTDLSLAAKSTYREPSNVRKLNEFSQWMKKFNAPTTKIPAQFGQKGNNQSASIATSDDSYFVTDSQLKQRLSGLLTPQYTLISSGTGFRWKEFDNSSSVTWKHNGGDNYATQISQALSAWNSATGSNISITLGGSTTANKGLTGTDGVNTILFGDPNNEIGGTYSCTSGGTLGMGGPFSSGLHTYNSTTFNTTVEGDVVIQNGAECFLDQFSKANAAEIVGHEVGHALGFGHACGDAASGPCDNNPSGDNEALMRASAHDDGRGASLGTDDVAAAAFLYSSTGGASPQPPTISTISDQTINQDSSTSAIAITLSDPDGDVSAVTLSATSNNTTLLTSNSFQFSGTQASRTLIVTPKAATTGTAVITVTATDSSELSASTQFTLTVKAVNKAPTIASIADQSIPAGTSTSLTVTVGDEDDGTSGLTLSVSSTNIALLPTQNIQLSGTGSSRTVNLIPVGSSTGTSVVTLTVSDGKDTASTTFTVSVVAVNKAPTLSTPSDQTIETNGTTGALAVTVADPDGSTSSLTLSATSSNTSLIPSANVQFGGSAANRTVTVTPIKGQTGTATITLTVSDGQDSTSTQFTVTVAAPNEAPSITSIQDQSILINGSTGALAFTATDPEGDSLSFSASSSDSTLVPASGILISGSGPGFTVVVTPAENSTGSALITLKVSDGHSQTSTQFTLTVKGSTETGSTDDSGPGSLRSALASADDEDSLTFNPTDFPQDTNPDNNPVIRLSTPLVIDRSISINGDVNNDGIPDVTIQGSPSGLFQLTAPGTVELSGLVLTGSEAVQGGALSVTGGASVTISNAVISNNTAESGGALFASSGTVTLTNTTLTGNVSGNGGGIVIQGAAQVIVSDSSLEGNAVLGDGGAIWNSGGILRLTNTTVSGNESSGNGGAIFNTGGGLVNLNNVTISENSASSGAGYTQTGGNTTITNSIIVNNQLKATGGFRALADEAADVSVNGGSMTVRYSGIKKITGSFNDTGTNLFSTDLKLEPAQIVGVKKIYRLQPGSPAIDAGDPNIPGQGGTCATKDIVGKARPIDGDGDFVAICDMGAFEYDVLSDTGDTAALVSTIQEQYMAFYGRPGDPGGVRYWVGELSLAGGDLSAIQNQFGTSKEFSDLIIPGDATTVEELTQQQKGELISNLYLNMFGRTVEGTANDPSTGLGFWTSELEKPGGSLIDISTRVADGAQNDDRVVLDNRVRLSQRISEAFVNQGKDYTEAHIATIRQFIFDQINDASDNPETPDVETLVSGL